LNAAVRSRTDEDERLAKDTNSNYEIEPACRVRRAYVCGEESGRAWGKKEERRKRKKKKREREKRHNNYFVLFEAVLPIIFQQLKLLNQIHRSSCEWSHFS